MTLFRCRKLEIEVRRGECINIQQNESFGQALRYAMMLRKVRNCVCDFLLLAFFIYLVLPLTQGELMLQNAVILIAGLLTGIQNSSTVLAGRDAQLRE